MANPIVTAAGPILRRVTAHEVVLWLALEEEQELIVRLSTDFSIEEKRVSSVCKIDKLHVLENLWVYLIKLTPALDLFVERTILYYDILLPQSGNPDAPTLSLVKGNKYSYGDSEFPSFMIDEPAPLLTGSCRKPHTKKTDDMMVQMSSVLSKTWDDEDKRPKALFLMGDQIYADDVSEELVKACQKLAAFLCGESYREYVPDVHGDGESALVLKDLNKKANPFYRRQFLKSVWNRDKYIRRCGFTSGEAKNHLILFCEYIAMYLLVWNKWGWHKIASELDYSMLENFVSGLDEVAKLLANVPTYMMFDDHDVTDDWNINRHWQNNLTAPGKKVVNNALTAYWIFQGWGNTPETFASTDIKDIVTQYCIDLKNQQQYHQISSTINSLREQYQPWGYSLKTKNTEVVVFDIRTRRYKGEQVDTLSGLMQPQYLKEVFSNCALGMETLIIVSPAPIFGFSKIEKLQGLLGSIKSSVTFADRENWCGDGVQTGPIETYDELLNQLFRLKPKRLIVISGDVHYGFVKKGILKDKRGSNVLDDVGQLASSALQNQPGLSFIFKLFLRFESLWFNPSHNTNSPNLTKSDQGYILFYRTNFGVVDYRAAQSMSLHTLDDDDTVVAHRF